MKAIILFLLFWVCSVSQAGEYFSDRYSIDIDHSSVKQDQRIVSFKINLKGGKFDSIDPLPPGWSLIIKNESTGVASMEGEIDVGVAAISVKDFVNTISLRKYLEDEKQFSIKVELVLLGGYEESKDTTIELEMRQIRLVKVKAPP